MTTKLALETSTTASCTACKVNGLAIHVTLVATQAAVDGAQKHNAASFHCKRSCSSCCSCCCSLILISCAAPFSPQSAGVGHHFICFRPVEDHFALDQHRANGKEFFPTAVQFTGDQRLCSHRLQWSPTIRRPSSGDCPDGLNEPRAYRCTIERYNVWGGGGSTKSNWIRLSILSDNMSSTDSESLVLD